jgi:hypothetical protein
MRDKVVYGGNFNHKPMPKSVERESRILHGGDCFNYFPLIMDYVNNPRKLDLDRHLSMPTHLAVCERCMDHYHELEAKAITRSK